VAWPTAEFASHSIDGLAKLSARLEMGDNEDPKAWKNSYRAHLASLLESARAVNSGGTHYGIDDVIDPAETRGWIVQGLMSAPPVPARTDKKRPNVDTW
jgi:acetyl-CoA carboxylase carboxyltransferase component